MTKRSKEEDAAEAARKARLASALRENLKRRKAQARGRRDTESAPGETGEDKQGA